MKNFSKVRNLVSGLTLGVSVLALSAASTFAAPTALPGTTPPSSLASGAQAKPPVEAGKKDAKASAKLGPVNQVKTDTAGKPVNAKAGSGLAGSVAGVDFQTFYNYCYKNLVYTTVRNTTTTTKYIYVTVYSNGTYHEIYTSIASGGTYSYPAFYGIEGGYSAYLYVWNGSYYQYDEYKGGTNTCNVSVTRVYNAGGWVQLKYQNYGTAYATQVSSELAPYPGSGTYTGTHYDYPAAGGAAIYRWFWVGTSPYGIVSYTSGSTNSPVYFTGDL